MIQDHHTLKRSQIEILRTESERGNEVIYITVLGFNYCREPGPLSLLLKIVCGHKHGFTGVMPHAGCWENTRKACLEITNRSFKQISLKFIAFIRSA